MLPLMHSLAATWRREACCGICTCLCFTSHWMHFGTRDLCPEQGMICTRGTVLRVPVKLQRRALLLTALLLATAL